MKASDMTNSGNIPRVYLLASTLSTGGAERIVRALASGLPAYGFATHVLCLHAPGPVGTEIAELGIPFHSHVGGKRYNPLTLLRLVSIFRGNRGALLFSLDHHDAVFWGAIAAISAGIKRRVMSVHSTGLWAKGSSFSFSDRIVLPLYDRIVALANLHAGYLERKERINRKKISIINNGVDTNIFHPIESEYERNKRREAHDILPGSFVVTIVAALRPEKNHQMLIHSAAEIAKIRSNSTYLIVGDGEEAGKLQELVDELSLGGTVRFMGWRTDIAEILSISDVSVLCSHPVVETFPLSVLESMASGNPVIATKVGALPEIITDREEGILIPCGETRALTDALLSLERNPGKGREMGRKGMKKVREQFSEERMVRNYAKLFRDLIGEGE